MFYTYIFRSKKDNKLYIGYTNDLKRRIEEHNSGTNESTKFRRPFELIYYEAYKAEQDAKKREDNLKLFGRALGGLKRRISSSLES